MNDDDLPRTSLDRLGDALSNLYKAIATALEKDLMRIVNFLKGIHW